MQTLKQRRWKPELTWEMLYCLPAHGHCSQHSSTNFSRIWTRPGNTVAMHLQGLPKTIYLVACSEKAQPFARHSASHLFTRSTLQTTLFLRTLNRATEATPYLVLFKLYGFLKLRQAFLCLLKSILQLPCFLFKMVEIAGQLHAAQFAPMDWWLQYPSSCPGPLEVPSQGLEGTGTYTLCAAILHLFFCIHFISKAGQYQRVFPTTCTGESPPKPPLLPHQGQCKDLATTALSSRCDSSMTVKGGKLWT